MVFLVFDFSFKPHNIASFVTPFDLVVILSVIKESPMVLRVTRPWRLPLWIEQSVWVSLRVAGNLDCRHIGEVGYERPFDAN